MKIYASEIKSLIEANFALKTIEVESNGQVE
jgi:hypothetical protein